MGCLLIMLQMVGNPLGKSAKSCCKCASSRRACSDSLLTQVLPLSHRSYEEEIVTVTLLWPGAKIWPSTYWAMA